MRHGDDYSPREPRFRRHEDAGPVPEIVDLPPLYTDVPRDRAVMSGGPPLEEAIGLEHNGPQGESVEEHEAPSQYQATETQYADEHEEEEQRA